MKTSLSLKHFLLALAVVAVWGTNFVVIKLALGHMPPLMFATLRFAVVVVPAVLFVPRPAVGWRNLAAYGLLIGVGQFGLLFVAMNGHISPGLASLVIQVQVFFTIGLAMMLAGESLQRVQWVALALGAAGLGLIVTHTDGSTTPLGLGLILLAALSWAGGNLVSRAAGRINMVAYVVWSSLFAVPPLALLALTGRCTASGCVHLGGRRLAGGGQFVVWLRGLGLAAGTVFGCHHHTHGAAGAAVWHGWFGPLVGRAFARLEAAGSGAGAERLGPEFAVALVAAAPFF